MKRAGVLLFCVALAGCTAGAGNFISDTVAKLANTGNLYAAEAALDGAIKTFNYGKDLCARRVIPSSCRTYVLRGQGVLRQINAITDRAADAGTFAALVDVFKGTANALEGMKP